MCGYGAHFISQIGRGETVRRDSGRPCGGRSRQTVRHRRRTVAARSPRHRRANLSPFRTRPADRTRHGAQAARLSGGEIGTQAGTRRTVATVAHLSGGAADRERLRRTYPASRPAIDRGETETPRARHERRTLAADRERLPRLRLSPVRQTARQIGRGETIRTRPAKP